MSDLHELYQELILDHNRRPRNFRGVDRANRHAEGYNPLCGDRLSLELRVVDGVIEDVGFQGSGCAISRASASMMTDNVKGKTLGEALELFDTFHGMVAGSIGSPASLEKLGKVAVFDGVRQYPARVKCASLAWHTLRAAVASRDTIVSTETE